MTARQSALKSGGHIQTSDEEGKCAAFCVSSSKDPRQSDVLSPVMELVLSEARKVFYAGFQFFLRFTD